jgi:hypothetical protein
MERAQRANSETGTGFAQAKPVPVSEIAKRSSS